MPSRWPLCGGLEVTAVLVAVGCLRSPPELLVGGRMEDAVPLSATQQVSTGPCFSGQQQHVSVGKMGLLSPLYPGYKLTAVVQCSQSFAMAL